jgi:hypothetical protein
MHIDADGQDTDDSVAGVVTDTLGLGAESIVQVAACADACVNAIAIVAATTRTAMQTTPRTRVCLNTPGRPYRSHQDMQPSGTRNWTCRRTAP